MSESQRFRFVKDDDGHDYMIPAGLREQFDEWLEHERGLWETGIGDEEFERRKAAYKGVDFNDFRIGVHPSNYSFENPQADAR